LTRDDRCSACATGEPPQSDSGLCATHRIAVQLGLGSMDLDVVRHTAVPLALARLSARASRLDSELGMRALSVGRNETSGHLTADLALTIIESEVVSEEPDLHRVLRAQDFFADGIRLVREGPDSELAAALLALRAARLDARIAHQRGDYKLAVAKYEHIARKLSSELPDDDQVVEEMRLQQSLRSASLFLAGEQERSFRIAFSLLESVDSVDLTTGSGRLIAAKAIEHHLARNRIEDAVQLANELVLKPELQVPGGPGAAVGNVIALRDASLALAAYGEMEIAAETLEDAREMATDYGLTDQVRKISGIGMALEKSMSDRRASSRLPDSSKKAFVVLVHGFNSSAAAWDRLVEIAELDIGEHIEQLVAFDYTTKLVELNPSKRIADIGAIATVLDTYLSLSVPAGTPIVLVGHSQGGLVIQKLLQQKLIGGRSLELGRIRKVVLFACPNLGSIKFLSARRWIFRRINRQELGLRPFNAHVAEMHYAVVHQVVNAQEDGPHSWRVPFEVFMALDDDVVHPVSAKGGFQRVGALLGGHSEIIQPTDNSHLNYIAFRNAVLSHQRDSRNG